MLVRRALVLTSLLTLAACDGGSGGGLDAGRDAAAPSDAGADSGRCTEFTPEYCPREYPMAPIPIGEVCQAFVDAYCRANGLCCSDDARVYPSFAACVSDQTVRCEDRERGYELTELLAAGAVSYNQAAAGNQFARLATMGDMCVPIRYGDAILGIYRGLRATGDACVRAVECASANCASGRCAPAPLRFDPCTSHDDCASAGLRCAPGGCDFRLAEGAACADDDECESRACRAGECVAASPDATYCASSMGSGPAFE
ncbi:MAG: hypothetical protein KF729_15200 [Sandaracinaceae bacterium]|nr:hypothetical protein [Sandaracinaceae bacterium]